MFWALTNINAKSFSLYPYKLKINYFESLIFMKFVSKLWSLCNLSWLILFDILEICCLHQNKVFKQFWRSLKIHSPPFWWWQPMSLWALLFLSKSICSPYLDISPYLDSLSLLIYGLHKSWTKSNIQAIYIPTKLFSPFGIIKKDGEKKI